MFSVYPTGMVDLITIKVSRLYFIIRSITFFTAQLSRQYVLKSWLVGAVITIKPTILYDFFASSVVVKSNSLSVRYFSIYSS